MCVNGFRIKLASKFAFGSRNITHDDEDGLIHTVESTDRKTIDTGIKDVFPVSIYDVTTRSNPSEPPIRKGMEIGEASLEMELDTWATFPLISVVT